MTKNILVALPLTDELQTRLRAAVPSFAYRFTTQETATLEEILWADAILGNVPVELIRQNDHLEWFQSNFAGPDPYLAPGVLPPDCAVTNATGAYGLAISEWMLGMWLALIKDLLLYRDRQTARRWDPLTRPVRSIAGARVLCVGMGDIGSSFARRAHALGPRSSACAAMRPTARPTACALSAPISLTRSCPPPTSSRSACPARRKPTTCSTLPGWRSASPGPFCST